MSAPKSIRLDPADAKYLRFTHASATNLGKQSELYQHIATLHEQLAAAQTLAHQEVVRILTREHGGEWQITEDAEGMILTQTAKKEQPNGR